MGWKGDRGVTVPPSIWEKLMGSACPVDTFCTTAFDLTHLRTNLCVVFLSTGEHGYWHSGF